MSTSVEAAVAASFRQEWGRIVAAVISATGEWDLAEDCTQEAFALALTVWSRDGIPDRPGAWLTTTARNRAIDGLRRRANEASKFEAMAVGTSPQPTSASDDSGISDDRLRLIFTCCHPALALEARVALTLRTLAGLSTAAIARAWLVPEATMAKRLVRAKSKIRHAGIRYRVPPAELLSERLGGVLAVLYLMFNEGYSASAGSEVVRHELCDEAIRLVAMVSELMPDQPEAAGLHALMLLHHSRRDARVDSNGDAITLEDQDRSRWNRPEIEQGVAVLEAALDHGSVGPYQLQAAIAACHATAPSWSATDWTYIAGVYGRLVELLPSPIVELNRAVAIAHADGPGPGLALVDRLRAGGQLGEYHLMHAARADLLRRLHRLPEAVVAFRQALGCATNDTDRRHLSRQLEEIRDAIVGGDEERLTDRRNLSKSRS